MHFSEDHISAPRGCCAPKFLHALENDQVLLDNDGGGHSQFCLSLIFQLPLYAYLHEIKQVAKFYVLRRAAI